MLQPEDFELSEFGGDNSTRPDAENEMEAMLMEEANGEYSSAEFIIESMLARMAGEELYEDEEEDDDDVFYFG